jgi:hypothetical protein
MKTTLLSKYLVTTVLGLSFLSTLLYARAQIKNNPDTIPSPIPTQSATPTSIPTVKGATTKTQTVNSDPIIDCVSSHPNCYGESLRLKSSQCSKIFCCGFSDGRWELYPSEEKCKQAWTAQQPTTQTQQQTTSNTSNKVPVFLTYGKYTIYCPSQNVDAVKSIDATMTSKSQEWAKQFNDCVELQKSIDPCYKDCYSKMSSASWSCIQSYQDTNSLEYKSCQDKVTNDFLACTPSCPNPWTTCQYVYSEQKSMSNQISNLCK